MAEERFLRLTEGQFIELKRCWDIENSDFFSKEFGASYYSDLEPAPITKEQVIETYRLARSSGDLIFCQGLLVGFPWLKAKEGPQ
jgi:hypothetical protein